MVQMSEVEAIRRRWEEQGSPPCSHTRTDKEYELGSQTGDIACLDCGETWWHKAFEKMQQEKGS